MNKSGLSPQFILRASLCREPHCASETSWKDRAKDEIENLTWAGEYAERGYTAGERGVLLADWNYFPSNIDRVLEQAGFDTQWSDEWDKCEECHKLIRTSPDSYGWQPYYVMIESDLVCLDCIDWASYLESIEDNPRATAVSKCDPAKYGYQLISEPGQYESGFHPGQTDDPTKVLEALHAAGRKQIVFRIADKGQFDIKFETWERIPVIDPESLDTFTRAYIEAALWSSTDDKDQPLDEQYSVADIAPETLAKMAADCKQFQEQCAEQITEENLEYESECSAEEKAGHDFWLTRNGHGCGFWDGDWKEPAEKILTDGSKEFGEFNLYVGDDGRIYA